MDCTRGLDPASYLKPSNRSGEKGPNPSRSRLTMRDRAVDTINFPAKVDVRKEVSMLDVQPVASPAPRAAGPTQELQAALRAREAAECETVRRLARVAELRDP